jgi:hypothetical protein
METITISQNQLIDLLYSITHAQPIAFSALVDARARKTGNPFGQVFKLSRVQAFTGFDYEASVNRQLGREGQAQDFTAGMRSWGERVSPALVRKDNKFYLVAKVERTSKPVYLVPSRLGLMAIAKELIAAFLPASRPALNQGTEKEIVYRNYAVENIYSLSIAGKRYRIRHT